MMVTRGRCCESRQGVGKGHSHVMVVHSCGRDERRDVCTRRVRVVVDQC